MREVVTMAAKDLKLLLRDRVGFFFTFFFPLIYCVFFGTVFSGGSGGSAKIKVLVVDEDESDGSRSFLAHLEKAQELQIERSSRDQALDRVRRGDRPAFVALPKGFGEARVRMFWGEPPTIETGMDPARQAEAGMIQGILARTMFEGMRDTFSNPLLLVERSRHWRGELQGSANLNADEKQRVDGFLSSLEVFLRAIPIISDVRSAGTSGGAHWEPFRIESIPVVRERKGPKNSYEVAFPQGIIWGVMGCATAFGISLVIERTKGTLIRLRMAPISRVQILGGKAGACFATILAIELALITIGIFIFRIRPSSFGLLFLGFLCVAVNFVGIMMLFSVLGKTEQAAAGLGWAIMLIMAMIGGGMIPQFFMPSWLQRISVISPIRWSLQAMDGAIWRQYTLSEMLLPCAVLVGTGVICFAIGAKAFQWTDA